VCDGFCADLAGWHPTAWAKARAWSKREEEFVRRAGFVLMARLAVTDKKAADEKFVPLVKLVERGPDDARPLVKKAKSWALRQIGKRSEPLRQTVIKAARRMADADTPAARWVAADVLRELQDPAQIRRIAARAARRRTAAK
jgi:3-methyladenine DNA glycosylase AlkD